MTQQTRGPRVHERWAHLRFSVIGQLLAAPPAKGELKAAIEGLAGRTWWRERFTATPFWQVARAAFMPPVDPGRLPAALIERFAGDDADRLVALLRFMGPVTGGRMQAP